MTRKLSESETLKLVKLYRQHEWLWDTRSQDYKNRDMRSAAFENISTQMNIEGFDTAQVKSKIKTLRSTYYLEMNKIEKSTRPGHVYVPKLKWFDEMKECITKNGSMKRKSVDYSQDYDDTDNDVIASVEIGNMSPSTSVPEAASMTRNDFSETQFNTQRSKRSKLCEMAVMLKDIKSVNQVFDTGEDEDSDYDIFGKSVAAQLKKLSEEQAAIAQQEIQNILSKCRINDIRARNVDT